MKKNSTPHEKVNLFFSAFLIIAYVICGYFFSSFAKTQAEPLGSIIMTIIFAIFGLLVFYATRVGERKIVTRFSLGTLILVDIPALLIILACFIEGFPFHAEIANTAAEGALSFNSALIWMAAVALGYGIPYTFISGFETVTEEELNAPEEKEENEEVLEGGVEADIQDAEAEKEAEKADETDEENDEIVVEGTAEETEDE